MYPCTISVGTTVPILIGHCKDKVYTCIYCYIAYMGHQGIMPTSSLLWKLKMSTNITPCNIPKDPILTMQPPLSWSPFSGTLTGTLGPYSSHYGPFRPTLLVIAAPLDPSSSHYGPVRPLFSLLRPLSSAALGLSGQATGKAASKAESKTEGKAGFKVLGLGIREFRL